MGNCVAKTLRFCVCVWKAAQVQGPLNGGVSNGGVSRSGLVLPFLSFFGTFPIFLGFSRFCSGMVQGFSRFVPFLFLGLLRAPTRNSPERVRDTIWTFPEKSGKHPGLETPRFSFSQQLGTRQQGRTLEKAYFCVLGAFSLEPLFRTPSKNPSQNPSSH